MAEKPQARQAIVRAYDLVLTFESDKSDQELEKETRRIIDAVNDILQTEMIKELPQIDFDPTKKKLKIGVMPVTKNLEDI